MSTPNTPRNRDSKTDVSPEKHVRLGMYKRSPSMSPLSPWKDAYRERCLKRIRESRSKRLNANRSLDSEAIASMKDDFLHDNEHSRIRVIMEEEWERMVPKPKSKSLPASYREIPTFDDAEIDYFVQQLKNDMKATWDLVAEHEEDEAREINNLIENAETATCTTCGAGVERSQSLMCDRCQSDVLESMDCSELEG